MVFNLGNHRRFVGGATEDWYSNVLSSRGLWKYFKFFSMPFLPQIDVMDYKFANVVNGSF